EDAAVGALIGPELGTQSEIVVGLFRDQESAAAVSGDGLFGNPPGGVAGLVEIVHVPPVREHHPAAGFCWSFALPDDPYRWNRRRSLAGLSHRRQTQQAHPSKHHALRD